MLFPCFLQGVAFTVASSVASSFGSLELPSLYAALTREAEVMVSLPTVHATANITAPYEWILGLLQTFPLPDYVAVRFFRTDLTICLFSQALVMGGRENPACFSI
ncbi:hypothetical protein TNCV_5084801 [Trichonephila clavipes]|uniref:Secreted protein n=1 Tax=Trichonephila clavipes TaxID=2585209 RepID=A0A8X6SHX4_TRICX|nr:hypothetical protein TNCV_5084801 [Trichonephila clavipes]